MGVVVGGFGGGAFIFNQIQVQKVKKDFYMQQNKVWICGGEKHLLQIEKHIQPNTCVIDLQTTVQI